MRKKERIEMGWKKGYVKAMALTEDFDQQDSIQDRMLSLLELETGNVPAFYTDKNGAAKKRVTLQDYSANPDRLCNSLRLFARKRLINLALRQARYQLLDTASAEDTLCLVDRDDVTGGKYDLVKQVMLSHPWSRVERRILAKRFISCKTQVQIAQELGYSDRHMRRLYKQIDKALLSLELAVTPSFHSVQYRRPDRSRMWAVRYHGTGKFGVDGTKPAPVKTEFKPWPAYKHPGRRELDKYVDGSKGIAPVNCNPYAWHDLYAYSTERILTRINKAKERMSNNK